MGIERGLVWLIPSYVTKGDQIIRAGFFAWERKWPRSTTSERKAELIGGRTGEVRFSRDP